MKITLTLTEAEVKGLKQYLKSVSSDIEPKITKAGIVQEIKDIVSGTIRAGACGDYVNQCEREERRDADNVSKAPYYLD